MSLKKYYTDALCSNWNYLITNISDIIRQRLHESGQFRKIWRFALFCKPLDSSSNLKFAKLSPICKLYGVPHLSPSGKVAQSLAETKEDDIIRFSLNGRYRSGLWGLFLKPVSTQVTIYFWRNHFRTWVNYLLACTLMNGFFQLRLYMAFGFMATCRFCDAITATSRGPEYD